MNEKNQPFKVKDYTVSQEEFELVYNAKTDMLVTTPQPKETVLPSYYQSEDYISHTDAKRNLFEKAYHFVRSISLKKKLRLINSFDNSAEKKLLDIGCGTGDFLQTAKQANWNVFGVEPNEKARTIAQQKNGQTIFETLENANFEKQSFDVITLWHVLEHLLNLEEQIQTISRLLKPNGRLIIAVPNYNSFDAKYYKKFWAAFDVPRHLWHFSQQSIAILFGKERMEVTKTLPMVFDAFYVSLLSEKYKTKKSRPIHAFFIGFRSNIKAWRTKEYSSLIYVLKNS